MTSGKRAGQSQSYSVDEASVNKMFRLVVINLESSSEAQLELVRVETGSWLDQW